MKTIQSVDIVTHGLQSEKFLHDGWQFCQAGTRQWQPAAVPGTVHNDLLENGIIQDPFFRYNEQKIQWIEKEDWEYRLQFDVTNEQLKADAIELVFEGLDTYADVYLNNEMLLQSDNMFRTWSIPCRDILREGINELRVYFHSPVKIGKEKMDRLGYLLPAPNELAPAAERTNIFTRKAPFHYGWDWGPRMVTSGIWRPVKLCFRKKVWIDDVYLRTLSIGNDKAVIQAEATINSVAAISCDLELTINERQPSIIHKADLITGHNKISFQFTIDNPQLWWPNGLGEAYRYQIEIALNASGQQLDCYSLDFGVRTLELVQQPDETGHSFFFRVNGVPVFMKGANIIPAHPLTPAVSEATHRKMIESARDAHMNMVRVWGGAIYLDDDFYRICDENGILVWQDFMFACALQPPMEQHLENIRQEAVDNVKRLRNHACMALWCGNNEILIGWNEWGWQEKFSPKQKQQVWDTYLRIFHEILPEAVAQNSPGTAYRTTSPSTVNHQMPDRKSGDEHDWTIWFGMKPFSNYWENVPRFVSEWGMQSFPSMHTLSEFTDEEDRGWDSKLLRYRQRSKMDWHQPGFDGNDMIRWYIEKYYAAPDDFRRFVYVSQLMQALACKSAIEAHRSNRPHCMGSLYWQLNDCWPTISWSTVDFNFRWKAAHYAVKRAFAPVLITAHLKGEALRVFTINDHLQQMDATLRIDLMKFNGTIIHSIEDQVRIAANISTEVRRFDKDSFLGGNAEKEVLLHLQILQAGKILAENVFYFAEPRHLFLEPVNLKSVIQPTNEGCLITLSANTLVRDLYIDLPDGDAIYSDNFFDLLPGSEKEIHINTTLSGDDLNQVKYLWLNPVE